VVCRDEGCISTRRGLVLFQPTQQWFVLFKGGSRSVVDQGNCLLLMHVCMCACVQARWCAGAVLQQCSCNVLRLVVALEGGVGQLEGEDKVSRRCLSTRLSCPGCGD
jgi:hypothetical protein